MAETAAACAFCGIELARGRRGPAAAYCSGACRMAAHRDATRSRHLHLRAAARRVARTRSERARGVAHLDAYRRAAAAWPHPYELELGYLAPLEDYLRLLETRNS